MSNPRSGRPKALPKNQPFGASPKLVIDDPSPPPTRPENRVLIEEFDRLAADFLDYARTLLNHSRTSALWYERSYRNYRSYLLAGGDLEETLFRVRMHAIEEWIRWNHRRGISPVTMNTYWRGLRRVFLDFERRHGRPSPFKGLKPPKMQTPLPKARTGEECKRILDATEHYPWPLPHADYKRALAHAAIGVMLLAGLRRGEVVRLRYGDVQLADGTLRIINGKGIAGGRDRTAYVSPELRELLARYLSERERLGVTQPELFISTKTRRGLTLEGLRKIVERVRQASGVPFTAHMLRHSFITHLLRSEVPIHITKELAGHRDIATTLGYLRVFDDDLRRGIRKIRFT